MTPDRSRRIATGRASWYQHPGRTASGEKFNPNQLTAAHHTLPFGTRVRVVHEQTGRSVNVRINDRIPRSTRVLIDLSRASARALGVQGVARVSLYRV
jgi:rare lipoprotein A